ncbi:MAG: hypothetical protein RL755_4 [Pseudomonadota bacterium]|jgi:hypothetical protein
MAGNPQVKQGSLNRVRGSVSFVNAPDMNITAPFMTKEGLSLSWEGESVTFIDTMTGVVTSPEPYQKVTLTIGVLKTTTLGTAYKNRMENDCDLGDCVINPDSSNFPKFTIANSAIEGIEACTFNGTDPGFRIRIKGVWAINNVLWN